jgi:hypothetical protein
VVVDVRVDRDTSELLCLDLPKAERVRAALPPLEQLEAWAATRRSDPAYLAGALLVGLLGNALAGAWWLDPTVGLLIAAVAVKEGIEAWQGEGCCVSSPLDGVGFADDDCHDDCCAVQSAVPSPSPTAKHDDRC